MSVIISAKVYDDIENLFQYSIETFGLAKAEEYKTTLFRKITQLSKMPTIGHRHTELPDEVLIYPIEKHLVIYQILPSTSKIYIIRIVHQKVNFGEILGK